MAQRPLVMCHDDEKAAAARRVLIRHVLRNSLITIATLPGLYLPAILGGALITEAVFNYPGMGYLFYQAASRQDYPILLGLTVVGSLATAIGNLLADIAYASLTPGSGTRRPEPGVLSMPFLLIVSGPPGAGKSTVARELARMPGELGRMPGAGGAGAGRAGAGEPGAGRAGAGRAGAGEPGAGGARRSVLVEGDAFFGFLAEGAIEPWLPAAYAQNEVVTRAAAAAAGRYAEGGYPTVYDGVVGPWLLADFIAASAIPSVHYAVLLPSVERCVAQVAGRTGHGFTDEAATRHMHREFARAGIGEHHLIVDPPGSPAETAAEIMSRAEAGRLRYP